VLENPRPWQKPLGIAFTVVGAAGLGTGIGLGFLAKSAFDASNTGNPPPCDKTTNVCSPDGLNQRSDAVTKGNAGTGLVVGGAILAATGIVLWITAPSPQPAKAGSAFLPQVGLSPTGASLRLAW
jgi:hypothetical protein